MINKKKEGGFYALKVRLFLNEYDGIPLDEFCKAEKVNYSKMLNCLGRTNYQYHPVSKPKSDKREKTVVPDKSLLQVWNWRNWSLTCQVLQRRDEDYSRATLISNPKPTKVSHLIENISISINSRIGVNIGKCDVSTLSALIRKMEVSRWTAYQVNSDIFSVQT